MKNRKATAAEQSAALVIVDMINDFRFPDGEALFDHALPVAKKIADVKRAAGGLKIPVIYVNDNFKQWHDGFETTIEMAQKGSDMGREIVSILRPTHEDYYVLKPHRSGFYKTPLGVLLETLHVSDLVITGITTDICVFFTAHDAQMRNYSVIVPSDCTAAVKSDYHLQALDLLERIAEADTRTSAEIEILAEGLQM